MSVKIQIDRWVKIKTCQDGKFETVFADIMGGSEEDVWHRVMLGAAVGGRWRQERSCCLFAFRISKSCVFTSKKTEKYGENFESVHKVSMAFVAKK